jgi:hypothetical protein
MGDRSNKVSEPEELTLHQIWNGFPDVPDVPQWAGPFQDVGDKVAGEAVRRGMTMLQAALFGTIASFGPDGCDWTDEELAHAMRLPAIARAAFVPPRRKRETRKGTKR